MSKDRKIKNTMLLDDLQRLKAIYKNDFVVQLLIKKDGTLHTIASHSVYTTKMTDIERT